MRRRQQTSIFRKRLIQIALILFIFEFHVSAYDTTSPRSDSPKTRPGFNIPLVIQLQELAGMEHNSWRRRDFEIYAGDAVPDFIIFDTLSYEIQSKLFKRLAFFTEKTGYIGTIPSESELKDEPGYNAHNYYADSLARFFNKAHTCRIPLSGEEGLLRDILLANSIIKERSGAYYPGWGGILSISRESDPWLRRHLLGHELLHSLYYLYPEYRSASRKAWQNLFPAEKEFWLLFLNGKEYEIRIPYLLVDEFQAYVLQQDEEAADGYFKSVPESLLIRKIPGRAGFLKRFLEKYIYTFRRSHRVLSRALRIELEKTKSQSILDFLGLH